MFRRDRFQVVTVVPSIAVIAIVATLVAIVSGPVLSQDGGNKLEPTTPISISGLATDQDDKPIAGAKMTLVSTNAIDKHLGEAMTDSEGRYVFRDVALPVRAGRAGVAPSGTFQVFGVAEGKGIAWHGMRFYHSQMRPENSPISAQDHSFYQGEPLEINLAFRKAMELTGCVKNDRGNAVQDVKIYLSTLDYLETEDREYHRNFREFWAMHAAPANYREATTGADGRFVVAGLPEDSVVVVRVQHPDYANQMFLAAITDLETTENRYIANSSHTIRNGQPVINPIWETRKVVTSPLAIVARSTRRAMVRVLNADDMHPAKGVRVSAISNDDAPPTSSSGKTDEMGCVELKLPPGAYRLSCDPPPESDYVRTYATLAITEEPAEQPFDVDLDVGCVLILEAADAASGAGIPGVSFMGDIERQGRKARSQVQSSTTMVDNPVTNANGELRAVVLPGTRNYSIQPLKGYRSNGNFQREVDCIVGQTVRVKFELEKSAAE
jgi:hypothetical protein